MYDSVIVKKKLPLTKELKDLDIKWDEIDFQTKDFDNLLSTYEITKAGKLKRLFQKGEWKDDDSYFLKGYIDVKEEKWEKVNYHGTFTFYTSHCTNDEACSSLFDFDDKLTVEEIEAIPGDDWWFEFEAMYTKGNLDSIKLIKAEKVPVKVRILNNKNWSIKRAEEYKKWDRKVVRFLRKFSPYKKLVRSSLNFVENTHSKLCELLYKLM